LGSGGMGTVYKVRQTELGKDYALKVLEVHKQTEVAVRRFQQEAKTAAALRHPNLVEVHDFGVFGDSQPYLVMDYVGGQSLDRHLKALKTLSVDYTVAMAVQVGFGLMYAHSHGVVHRDIKPGNIIVLHPNDLPSEGTVKVVDFGIAKLMQSEDGQIQELTRTGEIFGSPIYMSPEQCRGTSVDRRSDIYSLGCVIYECLTGLPPFVGDSAMSTMVKHLTQEPASLKEGSLGLDFPPALEFIVGKMLAIEPEDRYQDFGDVIQDLMRLDDPVALLPKSLVKNKSSFAFHQETLLVLTTAAICCLTMFLIDKHFVVPALIELPASSKIAKTPDKSRLDLALDQVTLERPWHEVLGTGYGAKDVLHFPSKSGHIKIGTSGEQSACGDFFVPPGASIYLRLNEEAAADDDFLKELSDVKFTSIEFSASTVGVSNSSMEIFRHLKHLDGLVIAGSPISTLEPIYRSPSLISLDVSDTYVPHSELINVERFNRLFSFSFGPVKNPTPTLQTLARNSSLTHLKYRGPIEREFKTNARGLNLGDVDDLVNIPNLSSLAVLNSPDFDDACLKKLLQVKKLKELELLDCGITVRSIPVLRKQKLHKLTMTAVGWTKEDVAKLKLPYQVEIRAKAPEHVEERAEDHERLKRKVDASTDLFLNSDLTGNKEERTVK